ncbi:Uma2 family endonuclease [soil metagenome]
MDNVTILSQPPPRRPRLTRAALESTPDDGYRYELLDGELFVTPAPGYRHQRVSGRLHSLLDTQCPGGLVVLSAPFAVGLSEDTEVQPDLLVAPRDAFTNKDLPSAPLLAVEVLSNSTRRTDLQLKWERYQRAGVASYWIVDPGEPGPHLTVWDLVEGAYTKTAEIGPDDTWEATSPFAVVITPGKLVD